MDVVRIQKLTEAVREAGFVLKKWEEETYGHFDRPYSGERYTGELIIKIRPVELEEYEQELALARIRKEREKNSPSPPAAGEQEEHPF
jgi:hypothetical protein